MKKYLNIIIAAVILISCQEVFVPDVEDVEPFLIVEGSISTIPGPHTVLISFSSRFQHNLIFKPVNSATVYVEDDLDQRTYFYRIANGVYRTDTADSFAANIGQSYILTIETDDGNIFKSNPQTVVACPEITSLYCNHGVEKILTENAYGEAIEIPFDGIRIYTGTDGILPYNNFYFYKYSAYEQHKTGIEVGMNTIYLYGHRRLSGKYSNYLLVGNADEFGDFALRYKKILFIAKDDMINYDPPIPESIEIVTTRFEGLIFKLQQYSLSPDAYEFWHDAETQLEAKGRLFDPVSPQLHGNIHCVSDTTQKIVGIFSASAVTEKLAYFYINYRNRTITRDVESMPELFLDTLHMGIPDDWISPPN
jgi:hypothetical protein